MLRGTLHFGEPSRMSSRNCVCRVDIGGQPLKLGFADFKVALHEHGIGERPLATLLRYPRWSKKGVWDLVVRAICLSLNGQEQLGAITGRSSGRRGAFAEYLTCVVEDWGDERRTDKAHVGTAEVEMCETRCHYRARFSDGITASKWSSVFSHHPPRLSFFDLLTRGYAWWYDEGLTLPKRPAPLCAHPLRRRRPISGIAQYRVGTHSYRVAPLARPKRPLDNLQFRDHGPVHY